MTETARQRIIAQQFSPRILELWQALQALKSCVSFMNTGAHPDDETSAMLAALSLRDGIKISYACANRGEGGQNDIGAQTTCDLGVLRTAEMEQAADALNLNMYWLSESPEDSIFDFGFSKSGVETLAKWGYQRTLLRFVEIVRLEKPDILCPTFLDIPGQHGHHRAMTQLAHTVVVAAADASFNGVTLAPWQIKKMYLPAWSGAGDAYDDDLPPPAATLVVQASGEDPVSGWTYEQIGQHSRRFHLTQGMGRWVSPGQERNWPLHLCYSHTAETDSSLMSALPATLDRLAAFANAPAIAATLEQAQSEITRALDAFPACDKVRKAASRALTLIRDAEKNCPQTARAEVIHRLQDKSNQLARVIRLASRVSARGWLATDTLHTGDSIPLQLESTSGDADALEVSIQVPAGWTHTGNSVTATDAAQSHNNYPAIYQPHNPADPSLQVSLTVDGQTSVTNIALESSPLLLPALSARLDPESAVLNTLTDNRKITLTLGDQHPASATASLKLPDGWRSERSGNGFDIHAPDNIAPGLYTAALLLDGQPASVANVFKYPHIKPCMRTYPAELSIRVLDVAIPDVRIAYVGGGNDRVPHWLSTIGLSITELTDADLTSDSALALFDTLIIGLFAIRTRPTLQHIIPAIHDWVERGGNLLTLYHRPWDDWNEHTIPPKRLRIGKPSLRWRVTDENATVTHLLPKHSLLNIPNRINDSDWQHWHKERGLYFASEWDDSYEALLSMADPDEAAHHGALVSARIGRGRHTHTSLILHHQMEKLIPGGFRLMANLVAGSA